jgi:hypothetical protein
MNTNRQLRNLLAIALAVGLLSCAAASASPTEVPVVHDVLRARAIELVDEKGSVRAQINVESSGETVLRLRDATGAIRVKMGGSEEGAGLLLLNDATEPGVQILAKETGSSVKLRNKDGSERLLTP